VGQHHRLQIRQLAGCTSRIDADVASPLTT
jgi:hypothetical protein